jgi:hypothetical protein
MGFVLELFFVLLRKFIPNWSAVVIMDHQWCSNLENRESRWCDRNITEKFVAFLTTRRKRNETCTEDGNVSDWGSEDEDWVEQNTMGTGDGKTMADNCHSVVAETLQVQIECCTKHLYILNFLYYSLGYSLCWRSLYYS